jgi:HAD superfamily 5'-nucleotidase-like hydrolase
MPNRTAARPALLPEPDSEPRALAPDGAIARTRQIFVNRNTRFDKIDLVGFDMDHTVAIYHKRRVEELSFEMTLARLVSQKGYSAEIASIRYDPAFVIRGLVIDKERGNIIKVDRHNYVGRGYHGRRALDADTRRTTYRNEKIRLSSPRYAWIDTLFALPEACLYASVLEILESRGEAVDSVRLYDDIREMIDSVHRDGSLKAEIKKDLGRYFVKDPDLGPALHKLRSGGKKLFLATNSLWDYTDAVMSFLLDGMVPEYPRWEKYFDYVIVGAAKPAFFSESSPFFELDAAGTRVAEVRTIERGRVYEGGNLADLERSAGIAGERVLYVGDHIYGDILRSRKVSLWRTCLVIEELEDEVAHTVRRAPDIRRLGLLESRLAQLQDDLNHQKPALASLERKLERDERLAPDLRARLEEGRARAKQDIDELRRASREVSRELSALEEELEHSYNPYWGFVFKEGNENSRFGEQVEDYACLYTSRVSNFLFYSPMQYFRAPRERLPHERE